MSEIINDSGNKKQRLGRGLGSLLGANMSIEESSNRVISNEFSTKNHTNVTDLNNQNSEGKVWNVDIEKIVTSEFQPRQKFTKETLQELAESIKQKGIIQPIIVRKTLNNKFEIVAGERRYRAAQLAGKTEVPVLIKTLSNKETLEIAIIENVQREDLNPIEEARAYQKLAEQFSLTQQQIAEKVGKERATIANSLRLLNLPEIVIDLINESKLSSGHAKCLLAIEDQKKLINLAQKTIEHGLSVRKLEKLVKEIAVDKEVNQIIENTLNRNTIAQKAANKLAEDIQRDLGTKVVINYHEGKGKITIHYYSDEELNEISNRIRN